MLESVLIPTRDTTVSYCNKFCDFLSISRFLCILQATFDFFQPKLSFPFLASFMKKKRDNLDTSFFTRELSKPKFGHVAGGRGTVLILGFKGLICLDYFILGKFNLFGCIYFIVSSIARFIRTRWYFAR